MTKTTTTTKTELLASKPAWAAAAIVANYEKDESDMMTDYFSTRTIRTVFLGWSRHKKDLFPELRKAAATYAETAHLASPDKKNEHREKYSMGSGYYLKASGHYSDGWVVKKTGLYFYGDLEKLDAPASTEVEAAAPVPSEGVTMTLNAEKNGVELRFPDKPSEAVRDSLKANGWRWSRFGGLWYHRDTPAARTFAAAMATPKAA